MILTYRDDNKWLMIPLPADGEQVVWIRRGEARRVPKYVLIDANRVHLPVGWDQCVPIKIDSTVRINV